MASFRFLVAVVALLGFGHQPVFAFPAVFHNLLLAREVPCDDITKYTTQFFLDNALYPPKENGLFYTIGWMESAIKYARTPGVNLKTAWDIWDCKYYNKNTNDLNNPLRCIYSDITLTGTYFENMCRAMAMLCNATALLMTDDPYRISQEGVWGRVEFPALKLTGNIGGQVNIIYAIDPQGNSETEIWDRDDEALADLDASTKRDGDADYCYSPEQLTAWFGYIDW